MTNATLTRGVGPSAPGRPRGRAAQLPGVDGIRAVAVIAVLVYHLGASWLPGGYLGVDVFFVISGYLITRLLIAERIGTGRISLPDFWLRRARRILPPLFPMLIATIVGTALVDPSMLHTLRTEVLGALTYTNNWVQIAEHQSYFAKFGAPSLLQHLWSLAVEEQFYIVWPLIVVTVLYLGQRRLAAVAGLGALGSAAAMAALYQPGTDPSPVYYGTATHSAGLLAGAVLAIAWPAVSAAHGPDSRRRVAAATALSGIGLAGIGVGLWLLDDYDAGAYRGGILAVSVATAVLIVGAGHGHTPIGWLLSRPPVRWLGARSYGLYLWHRPVLVLGDRILGHRTLLVAGVEVAVAVLLAAASYRWLERPVLRFGYRGALARGRSSMRGHTPTRRGGLVLAACAVAASCGFALVALLNAPAPPSSELERQLAEAQLALRRAPSAAAPTPSAAAPSRSPSSTPSPSPLPVSSPSRPPPGDQISALGDSVMLAASPALLDRLPGIQIDAVVNRSMQAAPAILARWASHGALRPAVLLGLGTNGPFPRDVLEDIVGELGPDRTLYLVTVYLPTRPWADEVNRTLTAVADTHPNVHLIDWQSAAGRDENLLYSDRIHPRPPEGADLYARTVVAWMSTPPPQKAVPGSPSGAPCADHEQEIGPDNRGPAGSAEQPGQQCGVHLENPGGGAQAPLEAGLQAAAPQPAGPPPRRVEGIGALLAVVVVLLLVPVSILVGTHVAAVVGVNDADRATAAVRARWQAWHHPHIGAPDASPGRHLGTQLSIWLDNSDHRVPLPPSGTQVVMSLHRAGLGPLFAIVANAGAAELLLRQLQDRARFLARERAWRGVDPHGSHWSRRPDLGTGPRAPPCTFGGFASVRAPRAWSHTSSSLTAV